MKTYLELTDVLARTKFGTHIYLIDLATDELINDFIIGKYDYNKKLPRAILSGEPFDFDTADGALTITISKDE